MAARKALWENIENSNNKKTSTNLEEISYCLKWGIFAKWHYQACLKKEQLRIHRFSFTKARASFVHAADVSSIHADVLLGTNKGGL